MPFLQLRNSYTFYRTAALSEAKRECLHPLRQSILRFGSGALS